MPDDPNEWLRLDSNELVLRRCMYWHSLAKEIDSGNTTNTTVYIPRSNVLDVNELQRLMAAAAREEAL